MTGDGVAIGKAATSGDGVLAVGKPPRPCRFCLATVAADVMQSHEDWHRVNDLHAASCRKAEQETAVHLTSLPCNCGLE